MRRLSLITLRVSRWSSGIIRFSKNGSSVESCLKIERALRAQPADPESTPAHLISYAAARSTLRDAAANFFASCRRTQRLTVRLIVDSFSGLSVTVRVWRIGISEEGDFGKLLTILDRFRRKDFSKVCDRMEALSTRRLVFARFVRPHRYVLRLSMPSALCRQAQPGLTKPCLRETARASCRTWRIMQAVRRRLTRSLPYRR
jgi:hypothetical protein